jgi:hypothetical protein
MCPFVGVGQKVGQNVGQDVSGTWLPSERFLQLEGKRHGATDADRSALHPGDAEVEAFTQGHGGIEEAQAGRGGVEVDLVPRLAATETLVDLAFDVR